MNHEEIFHLRDKFLAAAIQGVLANPNLVDLNTKPERIVHLANAVANRVLDARERYYIYEDKRKNAIHEMFNQTENQIVSVKDQ